MENGSLSRTGIILQNQQGRRAERPKTATVICRVPLSTSNSNAAEARPVSHLHTHRGEVA